MEESGRVVTMEDQTHGAQPNYLRIAKPLQEQLSSFLDVSYAVLNPVLWGSLPRELLVLVLARLPVPEITRLRSQLSKEWTMDIEFNRACDDWNPNMAALVSTEQANEFSPSASDGGLVCFESTRNYKEEDPLCIVVINLLTQVQCQLPPLHHGYSLVSTILYLKVDPETKGYKVVVIDKNKKKGCHTIETYDSISRQWSQGAPSWGHTLEIVCDSLWYKCTTTCAFDLEEGQLKYFDSTSFQSEGALVMQWALVGDRVFVLHKNEKPHDIDSRLYFVTKFQFQKSVGVWVAVGTHGECFIEEESCLCDILACEGVLMLRNRFFNRDKMFQCYFRNFLTNKSDKLPEKFLEINEDVISMSRVFWDANP